MTAPERHLTDLVEVDIRAFADAPHTLVDMLAEANGRRRGSAGQVWFLIDSTSAETCLVVGVRGELGALEWIDDQHRRHRPAHGTNVQPAPYFTVDQDDNSMPAGSEISLSEALVAAEEFVRTGSRPTVLQWAADQA